METATTRDGLALPLAHWPHPSPRQRVLVVHGLGEHAGRHDALARSLVEAGHAVWSYDQRGHGRAPGPRGGIAAADSLCNDLACVVDALQSAGAAPSVVLGHSLGGLVAARFVAETLVARPAGWRRAVPRLVLSSPALDAGLTRAQKLQLALLARLAPGLALSNGLQPEWISRDAAVVDAYRRDPLVHDRITPRLVRFIVDAGAIVRTLAPYWRTPTLLLWAGADRCVSPSGSAAFAAAAPPAVVQHQVFPSLAHEIFNEPERQGPIARLVQFLDQAPPAKETP